MTAARASAVRRLRGLGNISWLTPRQLDKLAGALIVSTIERRGVISEDKNSDGQAYVLLSGVTRISCRNRKGLRTLLMMVAPGMVPGFPPRVIGITYDFRCEAVTNCQVGTIALEKLIEISLGVDSEDFKRMATRAGYEPSRPINSTGLGRFRSRIFFCARHLVFPASMDAHAAL
jgi:hypothetical protein